MHRDCSDPLEVRMLDRVCRLYLKDALDRISYQIELDLKLLEMAGCIAIVPYLERYTLQEAQHSDDVANCVPETHVDIKESMSVTLSDGCVNPT